MDYQTALKNHLSNYKTENLGITKNGTWRKKPYPHILPPELYQLNILGTIKKKFWEYYNFDNQDLKSTRHINFHHLNSSQAMCFNLFFPFVMENYRYLPILLDTLQLPQHEVTEASFEKIVDIEEGTNFDFFIKYKNGTQILFETKLSETTFGTAKKDVNHLNKYELIYKQRIKNSISNKYQQPQHFFNHYQLIRNLSYLGQDNRNTLFFIYPIENRSLDKNLMGNLSDILNGKYADRVIVGHLENLVNALLSRFKDKEHSLLKKHFDWFVVKYIVLSNSPGYTKAKYTYPIYKRFKNILWK
jgi:hypothetical protein